MQRFLFQCISVDANEKFYGGIKKWWLTRVTFTSLIILLLLLHLVAKCDFCEQMLSFCKDEKGAKDKDRVKGKYMIFNCVIK